MFDQPANALAALIQFLDEHGQPIIVVLVPFGWNVLRATGNFRNRHFFQACQPRLKTLPPSHADVDVIPQEYSPQRRIGETPLAGIETVALVDERRRVLLFAQPAPEGGLSAIGIAGPFIEREYPGERLQIPHLPDHRFRQIVEHLSLQRIDHEP